jgi:hypothetical protein
MGSTSSNITLPASEQCGGRKPLKSVVEDTSFSCCLAQHYSGTEQVPELIDEIQRSTFCC